MKFCGKRLSATFYHLPQNEGETTAERVGFSPKSAGAKCRVKLSFALIITLSHGTFNRRLSEAHTVSRALYAAPHLVKRFNQQHCVEVP